MWKIPAYFDKSIIFGQATSFTVFSFGNFVKKAQKCWDLNKGKTFCKYTSTHMPRLVVYMLRATVPFVFNKHEKGL